MQSLSFPDFRGRGADQGYPDNSTPLLPESARPGCFGSIRMTFRLVPTSTLTARADRMDPTEGRRHPFLTPRAKPRSFRENVRDIYPPMIPVRPLFFSSSAPTDWSGGRDPGRSFDDPRK